MSKELILEILNDKIPSIETDDIVFLTEIGDFIKYDGTVYHRGDFNRLLQGKGIETKSEQFVLREYYTYFEISPE